MVGPPVIDRSGNKSSYQVCITVLFGLICVVWFTCIVIFAYRVTTDVITTLMLITKVCGT